MSTAGFQLRSTTVSALGTSQAAFVWLFERAGVGKALALALPFVGLGMAGNLRGAALHAVRRSPRS